MQKSPYDTNEYKTIILENGLRVIFVHDKNATKSGAALAVSVGSFDETIAGTAHFLEHLLFMGSEKYPNENIYGSFISEHGGNTNAYTADTYTNYLFDINSDKFIEALDMFSQMFVSSLLNESAVERELKAVNSEFTNYCNSDGWRTNEAIKQLSNSNHPWKNFNVGNTASLNIPNIVEHVKDLYKSKYSANLMNLCLVSNLEFDVLEPCVRQMFEQIPNKNYSMNKQYPPFFTSLQKTLQVIPIKNHHKMKVTWQIQKKYDEQHEYLYKPHEFLCHIFGHEGDGSILSKLKNLNWASALFCGVSENCFSYELFTIDMILTDDGIQNVDNILNIIYDYTKICVSDLGNYDKCKILYDDNKNSHNLSWTFASKTNSLSNAINTAAKMHNYNFLDLNLINRASHYVEEFNDNAHNLICTYLSQFSQTNSIIVLESKKFEAQQLCYSTEQWYKSLYTILDNDTLEFPVRFNGLHLPQNNIFIPTDLLPTVERGEWEDEPKLITSNNKMKIFCKKTNKFGLPHASSTFVLSLDGYYTNIKTYMLTVLLSSVLTSQLNNILYDAILLNYSVNITCGGGLYISLYGFHEKLPDLLKVVIEGLTNTVFEESFFDLSKEQLIKKLENEKFAESSKIIMNTLYSSINPEHMKNEDKIDTLSNISYCDLISFTKALKFDNCVALLEGNINQNFIDKTIEQISMLDFIGVDNYIKNEILQPLTNIDYTISKNLSNPKELNDCICVTYCYGKSHYLINQDSFRFLNLANLVNLFVKEPFFDELRTKQQLGYTVYSYGAEILGRCFEKLYTQVFLIQSPNTRCEELLKRIDAFIANSVEKMKMLDDLMFNTYVTALRVELSEPDNSLLNSVQSDLNTILNRHIIFNYKSLALMSLEKITKDELINFFLEHYVNNVKRYVVKLSSISFSTDLNELSDCKFDENADNVDNVDNHSDNSTDTV